MKGGHCVCLLVPGIPCTKIFMFSDESGLVHSCGLSSQEPDRNEEVSYPLTLAGLYHVMNPVYTEVTLEENEMESHRI